MYIAASCPYYDDLEDRLAAGPVITHARRLCKRRPCPTGSGLASAITFFRKRPMHLTEAIVDLAKS